jgi:hypothetical protein
MGEAMFQELDGREAFRVIGDDNGVYATDDRLDAYKWASVLKIRGQHYRMEDYAGFPREERPVWWADQRPGLEAGEGC